MYSNTVEHHFSHPRNQGRPERWNVQGVAGDPSAGPFMLLYLHVEGDLIKAVGFETYGCGAAVACGSFLTELVKGRTLAFAASIDAATVRSCLGGLPLGKEHCADLAAGALASALRRARELGRGR